MAANNVVTATFPGAQNTVPALKFEREGGLNLLRDFLVAAVSPTTSGWRYTVLTTVRTGGATPPVRVRRHDDKGVHVYLKPGDNATGVRGLLHPPGGIGHDVAFRLLATEADRRYGKTAAMPEPQGTVVNEETTELFLMAVDDAAKTHYESLEDFYDALVEQFPLDADADGMRDVSAALQTRGFVQQLKHSCIVGPAGRKWLEERQTTAAADEPEGGGDPLAVLLRSQDRLRQLLGLPEKVFAARKKVADLEKQIEELMEKQDAAKAEEKELLAKIDPNILKFLMTPEGK